MKLKNLLEQGYSKEKYRSKNHKLVKELTNKYIKVNNIDMNKYTRAELETMAVKAYFK